MRGFRSWTREYRIRGAAWTLAALWVGIGVAASGYVFFVSTKTVLDPTSPFVGIFDWPGGNWNDAVVVTAALAGVTWLALTIPVLIAGLRRILRWPGKRLMAVAWAGAWIVGVALMASIPASVTSAKTLSPVANWQELVIGAGFLTLAAVMALILARPADLAASRMDLGACGENGPG